MSLHVLHASSSVQSFPAVLHVRLCVHLYCTYLYSAARQIIQRCLQNVTKRNMTDTARADGGRTPEEEEDAGERGGPGSWCRTSKWCNSSLSCSLHIDINTRQRRSQEAWVAEQAWQMPQLGRCNRNAMLKDVPTDSSGLAWLKKLVIWVGWAHA